MADIHGKEQPPLYLSRAEVRDFDRRAIEELDMPGILLMENAGRNVAGTLRSLGIKGPVTVCCGKGNNGGDGFVVARHLDNHGVPVRVILFANPRSLDGDAAVMFRIMDRCGVPTSVCTGERIDVSALGQQLSGADWIVDALFGTGLSGPIGAPLDAVVGAINAAGARVLAVDIPSGLDCDTGTPLGPVIRAHETVTFVAMKKGFANPAAWAWTGRVHVADIGVRYTAGPGQESAVDSSS
jgi:NAD(P)H-hydrate epimerase